MLAALYGTLASRSAATTPGNETFYGENELFTDVLFGPPINTLFYAEVVDGPGVTAFGPPINSLFYAENTETVGVTAFGPPPNSLFYAENMNGTSVTLFSASDFLMFFTEIETDLLPLVYGTDIIYFSDEDEFDANLPQVGYAPISPQTLFFNTDEGLSSVPLAFGST